MSAISNHNLAQAIYLLAKERDIQERSFYDRVVNFLVRKKLLGKAPEILNLLNKIINDREKIIEAKVSSAEKLDEKTNKTIAEALIRRYGAKEADLIELIDPNLIGGYKIEVNDEVLDLSIKNRMAQLQAYLTKQA